METNPKDFDPATYPKSDQLRGLHSNDLEDRLPFPTVTNGIKGERNRRVHASSPSSVLDTFIFSNGSPPLLPGYDPRKIDGNYGEARDREGNALKRYSSKSFENDIWRRAEIRSLWKLERDLSIYRRKIRD